MFLSAISCRQTEAPRPVAVYFDFVDEYNRSFLSDVQWIDIGAPESLKYLGNGWGRPEKDAAGTTYAYAVGSECAIKFWANRPGPIMAAFRAQAFPYPDAPPQNVSLFVNGRQAGGFVLLPQFSMQVVEVGAEFLVVGENILKLQFEWTKSPTEVIPGARDDRRLAAYFDYALIYGNDEAAQLFIQKRIWAGVVPIAGYTVKGIRMTMGSGARYPGTEIKTGSILKFSTAQDAHEPVGSGGWMEVLFKPDGKPMTTLYRGKVAPSRMNPELIEIDLSHMAPARGDMIFRVDPVGDAYNPVGFLWIEPRLLAPGL